MTSEAARTAYAVYSAAVGDPLPTFDELGERQQKGWDAVAGMRHVLAIGDEAETDSGIRGIVRSQTNDLAGLAYWLECIDSTGRPFDHFAREEQLVR